MYGIFTYIYRINQPNVGKYTYHTWILRVVMLVFGFWGGIEEKFIQFVFGAILFPHVFCFA